MLAWCLYGGFLEFHTVLIVCCDDVNKCFVFSFTAIFQTGIVYSSITIQYQSMGVGSLSFLGEIELAS